LFLTTTNRSAIYYKRRGVKDAYIKKSVDSTMNKCKTCSNEISWDGKKREALHIRGPVNLDGTIHQCITKHNAVVAPLDTKELGLTSAIHDLTSTINILISLMVASTEAERNQIKRQLVV
jgi:hypothetical protein